MGDTTARDTWTTLTHEEKNRILFQQQKELLEMFLKKGALSKEQYEKSLHDLTEKMGARIVTGLDFGLRSDNSGLSGYR